jgi:hypothetical protein
MSGLKIAHLATALGALTLIETNVLDEIKTEFGSKHNCSFSEVFSYGFKKYGQHNLISEYGYFSPARATPADGEEFLRIIRLLERLGYIEFQ